MLFVLLKLRRKKLNLMNFMSNFKNIFIDIARHPLVTGIVQKSGGFYAHIINDLFEGKTRQKIECNNHYIQLFTSNFQRR